MARNLNDLANRLESIAENIDSENSRRAIVAAKVFLDTVVYRTPVDTSTALSNWQVTLDSPATDFREAYVPGYLGYTMAASARAAIDAGEAVLRTKKPGQSIFITNNTPYIMDLERGRSKQAPQGFLQVSLLAARRSIPEFKLEGKK
jgi:hypothetical protein